MKIDREKLNALIALPDREMWSEILKIGAKYGIRLPNETPPHGDMEALRDTVRQSENFKLSEALRLINAYRKRERS